MPHDFRKNRFTSSVQETGGSKFKNRKTELDGILFDSKKEALRYADLKLLQNVGKITGLERQKVFELIPAQKQNGKTIERACTYKADFVYWENERLVVEDVKGIKTDVYKIKRKLMLFRYGIRIKEL